VGLKVFQVVFWFWLVFWTLFVFVVVVSDTVLLLLCLVWFLVCVVFLGVTRMLNFSIDEDFSYLVLVARSLDACVCGLGHTHEFYITDMKDIARVSRPSRVCEEEYCCWVC
jgi:hypothetical protein